MKKALIVLLILAVAGGLFAQTFSWGGYVNTGIGMLKLDDDDDASFGLVAKDAWVNGIRTQLNFSYTTEDGDAGFAGRIRAQGVPGSSFDSYTRFRRAYGWFKAFDGLFEMRGGRIDGTKVDGVDELWGDTLFDAYGLQCYLYPTDIITVGFGGIAGSGIADGVIWDADGLALWAGIDVNLDLLEIAAQFRYKESSTDLFGTVAIPLGIVDVDAGAYFYTLNEFSDVGQMFFTGHVGLNVMDGLGLHLGGIFGKDNSADDPWIVFGAWADFALGNIKPSLSVAYAMGAEYDYGAGLAFGNNWWDYTFVKDQSYLTINPAVTLSAAKSSVEIGAVLNMDMGDANAAGSSDKGMSYAFYVGFLHSF